MRFEDFELIESRKNQRIIDAASLSEKKYRDKTSLFCADGFKLLEECLNSDAVKVKNVFFTRKACTAYGDLLSKAESCGAILTAVSDEVMDKLTEEKAPQGIFTVACIPPKRTLDKECITDAPHGFLILDTLQDPGNVGTIIRTAVSLGLDNIILCNCADIYSRKTLRGAMGAVFRAKICYADNITDCVNTLVKSGMAVYAAALTPSALPVGQVDFGTNDCIVIGNEGHGIPDEAVKDCTNAVIIPMQSGMDSLNAGIAASILIWEKMKSISNGK